jgi:hypothetical protein
MCFSLALLSLFLLLFHYKLSVSIKRVSPGLSFFALVVVVIVVVVVAAGSARASFFWHRVQFTFNICVLDLKIWLKRFSVTRIKKGGILKPDCTF